MKSSILNLNLYPFIAYLTTISCKKIGCNNPYTINYNEEAVKDIGSCEYRANCPNETINISFTELDLGGVNTYDLFVMNIDEDQGNLNIHLNFDGISDIGVFGQLKYCWTSDDLNSGVTFNSFKLSISKLHSNSFSLLDATSDSTCTIHNMDTNDFHATNLSSFSSNQVIGSIFSWIEENSHVPNMDIRDIWMAVRVRFTFANPFSNQASQIKTSHNHHVGLIIYNFNGDGYSYDDIAIDEFGRGASWIFFKFMNAENYVKQCYLKVISRRFEGLMTDEPFMSFAFSSWVI